MVDLPAAVAEIERLIRKADTEIATLEDQMDRPDNPGWQQRWVEDQCASVSDIRAGLIQAWQIVTGRTWEVDDDADLPRDPGR